MDTKNTLRIENGLLMNQHGEVAAADAASILALVADLRDQNAALTARVAELETFKANATAAYDECEADRRKAIDQANLYRIQRDGNASRIAELEGALRVFVNAAAAPSDEFMGRCIRGVDTARALLGASK